MSIEKAEGDSSIDTECPTCHRDDFVSPGGMRSHHTQVHGESLVENIPGGGSVIVDCDWCGGPNRNTPQDMENNERHFCDEDCQGAWQSAEIYGETGHKYNYEKRDCHACGTEIVRPPNEFAWGERAFCSDRCESDWRGEYYTGETSPSWTGGLLDYGPGWDDAKKELIRERDGRKCRVCGETEAKHIEKTGAKLTVHHIVKARRLRDAPNDLRNGAFNLVTLCREHHLGGWENVPPLMQFVAFLPHPPLPTEQAVLAAFGP